VTARERLARGAMPLLALVLGVAWVAGVDLALKDVRYPYFGDSASYIEMAESLRTTGRPLVSPWALESPTLNAVPQPVFPPGLPVLIAALTPLAGDARTAAILPNRIAAAFLPVLVLLMFRGYASDGALLGVGLWALLSPGVVNWHYVAYTDVLCLALAIVSLGALIRAEGVDRRWLAAAGFAAGCAYAVRNAALAVLVASLAVLGLEWLRSRGRAWRNPAAWLAGSAAPLGALFAYDLATFGKLQPYGMPPSQRPWPVNVADWVHAQLNDLLRLPLAGLEVIGPLGSATLLAGLGGLGLAWWWRSRADARVQRLVAVLGGYVAVGGAMLVASRSRYEWADTIEPRHALQYSWAIALLAVLAARSLPTRVQRGLAAAACGLLVVSVAQAVTVVRAKRAAPPDAWLVVARDPAVVAAVRALPPDTLIASNASVLFRIAAGRPVRLVEFGGGDAEFAAALAELRRAADGRPSAYVLWCHEWTARASACAAVQRDAGPSCTRLRGAPQVVALCATEPPRPAGG
jgi:hypothetical protein